MPVNNRHAGIQSLSLQIAQLSKSNFKAKLEANALNMRSRLSPADISTAALLKRHILETREKLQRMRTELNSLKFLYSFDFEGHFFIFNQEAQFIKQHGYFYAETAMKINTYTDGNIVYAGREDFEQLKFEIMEHLFGMPFFDIRIVNIKRI